MAPIVETPNSNVQYLNFDAKLTSNNPPKSILLFPASRVANMALPKIGIRLRELATFNSATNSMQNYWHPTMMAAVNNSQIVFIPPSFSVLFVIHPWHFLLLFFLSLLQSVIKTERRIFWDDFDVQKTINKNAGEFLQQKKKNTSTICPQKNSFQEFIKYLSTISHATPKLFPLQNVFSHHFRPIILLMKKNKQISKKINRSMEICQSTHQIVANFGLPPSICKNWPAVG